MTALKPTIIGVRRSAAALPETDGRQSEGALNIMRGCRRILAQLAFASLPEVTLANGRRADLIALSERGDLWIVEVKSCLADFEADQKWPDYAAFCDCLYFAVGPDFPTARLPDKTGIIIADRYGGSILRDAPVERISATRRRQVQLVFARTAASRLQKLSDPEPEAVQFIET